MKKKITLSLDDQLVEKIRRLLIGPPKVSLSWWIENKMAEEIKKNDQSNNR